MNISTRHLLSIEDLSQTDVELILQETKAFKAVSEREIKKVPTLRGRTVVNCFFEDSTRTHFSFELAEKRLSADVMNFTVKGSAMSKKGESLADTIRIIEAWKPSLWIVRHSQSGAPKFISDLVQGRVINAGDGSHEHPTQALIDLFTIWERKPALAGLSVGIVGDIAHSRVARSDILLFKKMGMNVFVGGPPTCIPVGIESYGVTVVRDMREVIPQLDALIALRIQKERMSEELFPSEREYATHFGINEQSLANAKEDILVMHPGPVNRGVELSPEVIDGPRSVILDQVTNGVAIRMAVMYLLMGEKNRRAS